MRLTPSEEQRRFGAVLHEMLTDADLPAVSAAWADGDVRPGRRLWTALAEAGVAGLLVPERWGGLGAGPDDLVIACEELGHHAVPGPITESVAVVPALLASLADLTESTGDGRWAAAPEAGQPTRAGTAAARGTGAGTAGTRAAGTRTGPGAAGPGAAGSGAWPDGMADKWLPELAAGRAVASMAAPPWLPFAADGDTADLILMVAGDEVRVGQAGRIHPSMDPARRLAEVLPGAVLAAGHPVRHAMDLGVLACAAQLLGAGRALLEAAVGYAKTRTQFGRPIGSFQAVRHQLADVAVAIEFARPLLYAAAVALTEAPKTDTPTEPAGRTRTNASTGTTRSTRTDASTGTTGSTGTNAFTETAGSPGTGALAEIGGSVAGRDVSAAKVACGEAAVLAARVALQVHGAIGYTREHGLGRWLTRVRVLHAAWGTPAWHRERILAELTNGTAVDQPAVPERRRTAVSRQDVAW